MDTNEGRSGASSNSVRCSWASASSVFGGKNSKEKQRPSASSEEMRVTAGQRRRPAVTGWLLRLEAEGGLVRGVVVVVDHVERDDPRPGGLPAGEGEHAVRGEGEDAGGGVERPAVGRHAGEQE